MGGYNRKYNMRDSDLNIGLPFFEWRFKAKIVDNIDQYKWTSYHSLVDKDKIKEYKDYIMEKLEF